MCLHRSHAVEADGAAVEDAAFESEGGEVSAAFYCVSMRVVVLRLRGLLIPTTESPRRRNTSHGLQSVSFRGGYHSASTTPPMRRFLFLLHFFETDDYDADAATRVIMVGGRDIVCRIFSCILVAIRGGI